jgi:hypothetical protein
MSLLEESKIIKSQYEYEYEYSISIEEFDKLIYEALDYYRKYIKIPNEKNSVSRYRNTNTNTNVSIINNRIIFKNNLHIHNIIDILDYMKINIKINPNLDKYTRVIKTIIIIIKLNSILEQKISPTFTS